MTALVWDQPGERVFQTGVDHGVLYLRSGLAVAWNGLTGVEDASSGELKPYYLDGVKYLENFTPGDYSGKLKAITYPVEFDSVNGISEPVPGLNYHNQPASRFSLSYRTMLGDDLTGLQRGYKIHVLYDLLANPDSNSFDSVAGQVEPIEFSWTLSGTPPRKAEYQFRPTSHISIDSTKMDPDSLQDLEAALYGTEFDDPSLPQIEDILTMLE